MSIPNLEVKELNIKSNSKEFCFLDANDQSQLTHYIYSLSDPFTDEICYIGKTKFPHKRFNQHWDLNSHSNLYFYKWIYDLQDILNQKPIMHVFLSVYGLDSFEKVFDIERKTILLFWSKGHPLLNKVNLIKERRNRILSSTFYGRVLDDIKNREAE